MKKQIRDPHRKTRELILHQRLEPLGPRHAGADLLPERRFQVGHDKFFLKLADRRENPAFRKRPTPEPGMHDRGTLGCFPKLDHVLEKGTDRRETGPRVGKIDEYQSVEWRLIERDVRCIGVLLDHRASQRQIIEIGEMKE